MSRQEQTKSILLLIDIQEAFQGATFAHWGPSRSNPSFEENATSLISKYRNLIGTSTAQNEPSAHKIIHVAHSSLLIDSPLAPPNPGFSFQKFATPKEGELVIYKHVNSAFIGTDLEKVVKEHFGGKPGKLYLAGLSTDHCVSTTTRMAGNLGVCDGSDGKKGEVVLIEDATAAWKKGEGDEWFEAEIVHKVHAESLKEFATVDKTKSVLDLWGGMDQ